MSNESVAASKPSKKDAYYVASGFFNEEQIKTVDKIEASLKGLNLKHFSPRQESIPFFKETNSEHKSMMTKLIFNNNLDCMDSCNKFIVNLQDEDQGTLFEYGYIVGGMFRSHMINNRMSRDIKVMNDATGLEAKVLKAISSEEVDFNFIKSGRDFDFMMDIVSPYNNIIEALNARQLIIVSIDDRDPINMFLVGFYFRIGIPVITYSRKGFGSNVMLVHSTYHCETEQELMDLLKDINQENFKHEDIERGKYLNRLRLNKQTWNKVID